MKKDIIIFVSVALIITAVFFMLNFQTVDQHYASKTDLIRDNSDYVSVSISCNIISGDFSCPDEALVSGGYIPRDGIILSERDVKIDSGDTAFDVLSKVAAENKIQLEYQGGQNGISAYIQGINYIYEFSFGDTSGWVYAVNGELPGCGCSDYKLLPGDKLEWMYTLDSGKDTGYSVVGGEESL